MISIRVLPLCAAVATALAAPAASAENIVATPTFHGIELEGGGHVTVKYGSVEQVKLVRGSTAFTRFTVEDHTLHIHACNDDCPHTYDLDIEITSPDIDGLAVSGGGTIEGGGGFPARHALSLAVNGGGKIDARMMDAVDVSAAVHGGGRIDAKAKGTLNAAVVGGGHIRYWGKPQVTQAVVGGGAVERGD
jgi:hypothetical protein